MTDGLPPGFAEGLRRQEHERLEAEFARAIAEQRERRRIKEHFEEVPLGHSAQLFGGIGGTIVVYECGRCRALVRCSVASQVEHLRHSHGVTWAEPPDCGATVQHDPPLGSVVGLTCVLHGGHDGGHRAFHDGRSVGW